MAPTGFLGQPIVGQDISAFLSPAEVHNLDCWDLCKFQQLGGLDPSVAGDYLVVLVDQDRICKTKFLDSRADLSDLFARMGPSVPRIRFQETFGYLPDHVP